MAKMMGLTPEEIVSKTDYDLARGSGLNQEEASKFVRDDREVFASGKEKFIPEEIFTQPDGTVRWFQAVKTPFKMKDERECVFGVASDITDRKRAETRLRSLYRTGIEIQKAQSVEEVFRIVGDRMKELELRVYILLLNRDEKYLTVEYTNLNAGLIERGEELAGLKFDSFKAPISKLKILKTVLKTGKARFYEDAVVLLEELMPTPIPQDVAVKIGRLIRFAGGVIAPLKMKSEVTGFLIAGSRGIKEIDVPVIEIFADKISTALEHLRLWEDTQEAYRELKEMQDSLIQSEKMAAIGELSASIAHEIRNPLGAIYNAIDELNGDLKLIGTQRKQMNVVIEATEKLRRIVDDFYAFARPHQVSPIKANIQDIVDDTLLLLRQDERFKPEIAVDIHYEENIPLVILDINLIPEVLINILINSVQAMPRGGHIWIAVAVSEIDDREAIQIKISDSGEGMPKEQLSRIFEPFYTTKTTGMGLGLAIVNRIVREHGGRIDVESEVGTGTTFTIRLPL
jgi:PAS domain S-box-containing protein